MSEISRKVMNKVRRIYLARVAGVLGAKFAFGLFALYFLSSLVFVRAIINNFINVIQNGNVLTYIVDALYKTEVSVLVLLALIIVFGTAMIRDIRKIISETHIFAR